MNIVPIIRHLLIHDQKVVIPGFGAFSILQHPARLNRVTGALTPPTRVIQFSPGQLTDDSQVLNYLVKKRRQSEASAGMAIREFSKNLSHQLRSSGSASIEGIGKIVVGPSGDMVFEAGEELQKLAGIFNLPNLSVSVAQPEAKSGELKEPKVVRPSLVAKRKRRLWVPAAVVVLIAGLAAFGYYSGMLDPFIKGVNSTGAADSSTDNAGKLVFGSRDEEGSAKSETDTLREKISRELDKRTSRENALTYTETQTTTKPEPLAETKSKPELITGKAYHIIAGAFMVPNNAERQKKQLEIKGYPSVLLPKKGDYFMVSLGSFDSQEEATTSMLNLKKQLKQELWVSSFQ